MNAQMAIATGPISPATSDDTMVTAPSPISASQTSCR